jgi:hypothetical protein
MGARERESQDKSTTWGTCCNAFCIIYYYHYYRSLVRVSFLFRMFYCSPELIIDMLDMLIYFYVLHIFNLYNLVLSMSLTKRDCINSM